MRLPLDFELCLLSASLDFLNQEINRQGVILPGIIDSDHETMVGMLLLNFNREEYTWHSGAFLLLCPILKINGQVQTP